ncbi:hypothetical protein EXIGLDRAFT_780822 [Exidia glandulosa HHB12029]|uniref:Uncharacterized protein n=1 Tax=Exidia glandulosa HHB12029 TaxID=1314781 RepID=A0A165BFM8_EXIGL|nr:hypothetical protein EXIGLDRAFT_780822 [Exidia glandulosa HHB12029]
MGRPQKYETAEERVEARHVTKRNYYERFVVFAFPSLIHMHIAFTTFRNVQHKREQARERWARTHSSDARHKRKEARRTCVLVATEKSGKILGGSLIPDRRTKWGELKQALREDLASWRGRRSATDRDEYDALVRDLIRVQAERSVNRLLSRIAKKQQLLSTLCTVAHTADGVLLDVHPGGYTNHFLQIYRDAMGIDCVLDSIILLYREGVEKLRAAYDSETMYWQSQ